MSTPLRIDGDTADPNNVGGIQETSPLTPWLKACPAALEALRTDGQRHPRDIDYRHLIGALRRKPGAFARSVLRDAMFPRAVYRQTWERLSTQLSEREACKAIVGLLSLAADGHEAQLAIELEQLIELDQLPDLHALTTLLAPRPGVLPTVKVELPDLAGFDALLGVQA